MGVLEIWSLRLRLRRWETQLHVNVISFPSIDISQNWNRSSQFLESDDSSDQPSVLVNPGSRSYEVNDNDVFLQKKIILVSRVLLVII